MKSGKACIRVGRWLPAIFLMALIFVFSSIPGDQVEKASRPVESRIESAVPGLEHASIDWLKVGHIVGYACLGMALHYAFRARFDKNVCWFAILACGLYALTDEFHQLFIPGRSAELWDVGLDMVAAVGMLGLRAWLVRGIKSKIVNRS